MRKLKAFTKVDLIVVVGLILVLFGASLTMIGKTLNKSKDEETLKSAATFYSYIQSYHNSNFNLYPVYSEEDLSAVSYRHVTLSRMGADANFLKINLGPKYTSFIEKLNNPENLVYVYKTDGSEAAVVIRKLTRLTDRCNVSSPDAPEIIKEYLIIDPTACYYISKS